MASERSPIIFPDVPQAIAFHKELMERLGRTDAAEVDRQAPTAVLGRMNEIIKSGEGDLFWVAAEFFFDSVRTQPFGSGSNQTAVALMLAFLLRNGIFIAPPDEEEIMGLVQAVADGAVYIAMVEEWLRQCARPASSFVARSG